MASKVSGCLTFCGGVHAVMLEVIMTKNTSSRLMFGLTVTPLVVIVSGLHWVLEFPADREPQEVLYGRERANIERDIESKSKSQKIPLTVFARQEPAVLFS